MRYHHTVTQSAEFLRLALQRMTRQDAGLHPASFALWYEYVAGANPALTEAVDALTRNGARLNDETTYMLYETHIAELTEESSQRIASRIERIVADVSESTARAGDEASKFGGTLERWSEVVAGPVDSSGAPGVLPGMLRDTQAMRGAIATLQSRLDASQRETAELKREVSRVRQEALVDALTGLANRRGFDRAFEACLAEARAGGVGPCLLMVDIDRFKRINDTYGHLFGDRVLCAVGRALQSNVKGRDTVARYGGEEFAVVLPETPLDGATSLAEALRTTVAAGQVRNLNSNETVGNITISIGVTGHRAGDSASELVERADRALYTAKGLGRNRVIVADGGGKRAVG
jgi:diguanylate cyclase